MTEILEDILAIPDTIIEYPEDHENEHHST